MVAVSMTTDSFIECLRETPRTWCLGAHGALRTWVDGMFHCPISALVGSREAYGNPVTYGELELGLSCHDAYEIACAADSSNTIFQELRTRLLEATGLVGVSLPAK